MQIYVTWEAGSNTLSVMYLSSVLPGNPGEPLNNERTKRSQNGPTHLPLMSSHSLNLCSPNTSLYQYDCNDMESSSKVSDYVSIISLAS